MPTQTQKEVAAVQFLARTPRGSATCPLKASRAARSELLPLLLLASRAAAAVDNAIHNMMDMRARCPCAMVVFGVRLQFGKKMIALLHGDNFR
jgi:hypothetical protein